MLRDQFSTISFYFSTISVQEIEFLNPKGILSGVARGATQGGTAKADGGKRVPHKTAKKTTQRERKADPQLASIKLTLRDGECYVGCA